MKIEYSKTFLKRFQQLDHGDKTLVLDTIEHFRDFPYDTNLRNHPLCKPMQGQRSISVGPDLRIIFREKDGYAKVIMLDVGTHERVYYRG